MNRNGCSLTLTAVDHGFVVALYGPGPGLSISIASSNPAEVQEILSRFVLDPAKAVEDSAKQHNPSGWMQFVRQSGREEVAFGTVGGGAMTPAPDTAQRIKQ